MQTRASLALAAVLLVAASAGHSRPRGVLVLGARCSAAKQAASLGQPFDLQGFIDRAVATGHKRIIPPGRYRVTPRDRQHLVLKGLRDVEIVAEKVEMICT